MDQGFSIRRVLLVVALVLLVLIDASAINGAVQQIIIGHEFEGLGVPNIGLGLAVVQIPVIAVLLWVTYRVFQSLRG
jgi:hypothetical protein